MSMASEKTNSGTSGLTGLFSRAGWLSSMVQGGQTKVLSITMEYGLVKLLVSRGTRVLDHRMLVVNPEFFREGLVTRTARVSGIIRNALQEIGSDHYRIVGAVPGFQGTIHVLQLPEARGLNPDELIPREASRTMGISLQTSHLLWYRLPNSLGRRRWLVVSTARRSVSSFLETVRPLGLPVRALDLRPFALARVVNQPEALVVWVAPDGCEVVVVRDSAPVGYQCLSWEAEAVEGRVLVDRLTTMVERTIAAYEQSTPDMPLSDDAPLYVCGTAAGVETNLGQQVADFLRRPSGELTPPMAYPAGFPVQDFAVNLGLALREA